MGGKDLLLTGGVVGDRDGRVRRRHTPRERQCARAESGGGGNSADHEVQWLGAGGHGSTVSQHLGWFRREGTTAGWAPLMLVTVMRSNRGRARTRESCLSSLDSSDLRAIFALAQGDEQQEDRRDALLAVDQHAPGGDDRADEVAVIFRVADVVLQAAAGVGTSTLAARDSGRMQPRESTAGGGGGRGLHT